MPPHPSTFSIVARDPDQNAVGVAVQSKFIGVGAVVPFAAADAGAIATQSYANVEYGPAGLDLLREGYTAGEAVTELTTADEGAPRRQVGIVGQDGSVAAFTGADCLDYAGDRQGENYTVQGNILKNRETIDAMPAAYEATDGGLPERLIAALHAGNAAGGDARGEQSAALYVARPGGGYDGGNDRWIDVRVDDHETPIDELERVFKLYDITLLAREQPDDLVTLEGETAVAVQETLASLGHFSGTPSREFEDAARGALEAFRDVNNFENHSIAILEDAIARGWDEAEGNGADRLVDAIWHGLSRLDRA